MSRVYLIAADKPLPLCNRQEERTSTHMVSGTPFTISFVQGFRVAEHRYYRHAVDSLGYSIKPCQYELELELCEVDLAHLKEYLSQNFCSGEAVELWSIWVGIDQSGRLPHYSGCLKDFDMETMEQFLKPDPENDAPASAGSPSRFNQTLGGSYTRKGDALWLVTESAASTKKSSVSWPNRFVS